MHLDCPLRYFLIVGMARAIIKSCFNVRVINREKLEEDGPCIFVANHQSFLDPPVIGQIFDEEIHFLARKTLYDNSFLNFIFPKSHILPIDQEKPDPGSILRVLRTVKEGGRILIFPEGSRTPDGKMHEAMPGIGLILGRLCGVPVVPIRIEGAYDCLPIHAKRLRTDVPITVTIGDPIPFTEQELKTRSREGQRAIGRKVMEAIAELPVSV